MAKAAVLSKALVQLLLTCCLLLIPLWESVIVNVLLYVILCPFLFCNHLDGEERADFFAKLVFLVSRDCCVALHRVAMGLSAVCNCSIS